MRAVGCRDGDDGERGRGPPRDAATATMQKEAELRGSGGESARLPMTASTSTATTRVDFPAAPTTPVQPACHSSSSCGACGLVTTHLVLGDERLRARDRRAEALHRSMVTGLHDSQARTQHPPSSTETTPLQDEHPAVVAYISSAPCGTRTAISAGAGSGKTTLCEKSFMANSKRPDGTRSNRLCVSSTHSLVKAIFSHLHHFDHYL